MVTDIQIRVSRVHLQQQIDSTPGAVVLELVIHVLSLSDGAFDPCVTLHLYSLFVSVFLADLELLVHLDDVSYYFG